LAQIPHFADRITSLTLQATFQEKLSSIESRLNNLNTVCQELTGSEALHRVLALVLTMGNWMNGGNHMRGQADGFHLEILGKLKDVKSQDKSMTLLHYLVRESMKVSGENDELCN
jgi:formin 2